MYVKSNAILWDLDGTIIDSVSVMIAILEEIFPVAGIKPVSREYIRSHFYGPLEEALIRITDNYTDQDELLSLFFKAQIKHYENPQSHTGIEDAIKYFSEFGYKQAIVTSRANHNRDNAGANAIIKTMRLDLHIETIVSAEDTPHHKPHPEPITIALERLGVEPENAIMIGDQYVDAQAAKAAGTRSILIDHEKTPESIQAMKHAQPDVICDDAKELVAAVQRLFKVDHV